MRKLCKLAVVALLASAPIAAQAAEWDCTVRPEGASPYRVILEIDRNGARLHEGNEIWRLSRLDGVLGEQMEYLREPPRPPNTRTVVSLNPRSGAFSVLTLESDAAGARATDDGKFSNLIGKCFRGR